MVSTNQFINPLIHEPTNQSIVVPSIDQVDVRDAAAMHVAAAEADSAVANGRRFLATSDRPVDPAAVVEAAQRAIDDEQGAKSAAGAGAGAGGAAASPESSSSSGGKGRRLFCSKNAALLGLSLRPIEHSLEDMARAMRALR